ncbi:MAG: HAD family phosphatase [Simkania sp.]|nr:HAD family phosphatase [Simkania sp.]
MTTSARKTVFFDMGNVLLFFSFARMCQQIGSVLSLPPLVIQGELRDKGLGNLYEKGGINTLEFHKHFCDLANKNVSVETLLEAASDIFNPNRAILPLLTELKRKGHRLFILSNTNEAHFSYVRRHYPEMLAPFDDYILSYQVGSIKPEETIFRAALKKTDSPTSHCFYTDDIPDFIDAATRVDIHGMVFTGIDPLMETLKLRGFL